MALLAVLPLFASCHKKHTETAASVLAVDVARPEVDSLVLHTTYPGVLSADREVDIAGRVNGTLLSKNYNSGDRVEAGRVLFTIDPSPYQDALTRAEAALRTAIAQQSYASDHYEALQRALVSQAVSRMEAEQGRSALESANSAVSTARADLNSARTNLSYCTIRAPFAGRISSGTLSVGSYIGGEGAPVTLAKIYKDDVMQANFAIDDASFISLSGSMQQSDGYGYNAIPLTFSDTLAHSYTGELKYMAPAVDPSTGTVKLQATVDNPYGELRSGMFVSIDLPTGVAPEAILVKSSAISRDQRGSYLYTVNDSSRIVYTPVTVGQTVRDSLSIITSGLSQSDRYVTRALLRVRPGMKVEPHMTR